eukprot:1156931-Pelagomonas_calceolata.AAC.7
MHAHTCTYTHKRSHTSVSAATGRGTIWGSAPDCVLLAGGVHMTALILIVTRMPAAHMEDTLRTPMTAWTPMPTAAMMTGEQGTSMLCPQLGCPGRRTAWVPMASAFMTTGEQGTSMLCSQQHKAPFNYIDQASTEAVFCFHLEAAVFFPSRFDGAGEQEASMLCASKVHAFSTGSRKSNLALWLSLEQEHLLGALAGPKKSTRVTRGLAYQKSTEMPSNAVICVRHP